MSVKAGIIGLSTILNEIRKGVNVDIPLLIKTLEAMPNEENQVLYAATFSPKQWEIIVNSFSIFSEETRKISNALSRFAVDKKEGTITIIGNIG